MTVREKRRFAVSVALLTVSYPFFCCKNEMFCFLTVQTPLKNNWEKLMRPVVDQLKLLIRFNVKTNCVELKVLSSVCREE